jgi:hypothetical protein
MSLAAYLQTHFVDKPAFAALAAIRVERLDQLIEAGAIPGATYVCNGTSIRSAVFGVIETSESIVGEYFRPECVRWVRIADEAPVGSEKAAVEARLADELQTALTASGQLDSVTSTQAMIEDLLPSFFDGTFGLCVADPSSGSGIARKELLQKKLTQVTDNGSNPTPAALSRDELLRLIDDYAAAAMPFSPAEYARSSRKRLVDDLRPLVARI